MFKLILKWNFSWQEGEHINYYNYATIQSQRWARGSEALEMTGQSWERSKDAKIITTELFCRNR